LSDEHEKTEDDTPELLVKLRERKEKHQQRNVVHRYAIVAFGVLVICAGVVLSGPGVPGPGFLVILIGISFLALEFDWAERLLERAIIFGDDLTDRAEQTSTTQRVIAGAVTAVAVAAFVVAAILWDIPLVPLL
jgi:uncharacterized protein (TIGR02611 family)